MNNKILIGIISGLMLLPALRAAAEDAEVKLNSNDGTTKLIVQDQDAVTVFSSDSDGNIMAKGTATVYGLQVNGGSRFLANSVTSYALAAGTELDPYSFFVSSTGVVGVGSLQPADVMDNPAAITVRPVLKSGSQAAIGIDVNAKTDESAIVSVGGGESGVIAGNFEAQAGGDDTLPLLVGLRGQYRRESNAGAGVVWDAVAIFADSPYISAGAGTIVNSYGIYIASQSILPGVQTGQPYALYAEDPNSRSYFAGRVGISSAAPGYALVISSAAGSGDKMLVISTGTSEIFSVKGNGEVYTTGRYYGDGSMLTNISAATDNLGTHVATTTLNMANFAVANVSSITMSATGIKIATSVFANANGIMISTTGAIITIGSGQTGSVVPGARGIGAVDLQTLRGAAAQVASGSYSTVSGGSYNVVSGSGSVVAGGRYNTVTGTSAVVAGGENNQAGAIHAAIGGGHQNRVWLEGGTIGGGESNVINGSYATVSGGQMNTARNYGAVVSGGYDNFANGDFAMIPGGLMNYAGGQYSFAAGALSSSTVDGAFTWADARQFEIRNTSPNRTLFKNEGGFMVVGSTVGGSPTLPGNQAMLDILSTGTASNVYAQVWRDNNGVVRASMTSTGVLYATMPPGTGDNLGSHTATQNLNMANSAVLNVTTITMSSSGLLISSGLAAGTANGIYISTDGTIVTKGYGYGTFLPAARGVGSVDLQVRRVLGADNVAGGSYSTITGGQSNKIAPAAEQGFIGGGDRNRVDSGQNCVVAGGYLNVLGGSHGFIGGGYGNIIGGGAYAGIVYGKDNIANSQYSSVLGGYNNKVNDAFSDGAVILSGSNHTIATSRYSLTAGYYTNVSNADGSFTWNDYHNTLGNPELINNVPQRAVFKTRGGFMVTGSTNTAMTGAADRGVFITGNGLVGISTGVPFAALDVVSSGTASNVMAQIWRTPGGTIVSSVSATGVLMAYKFMGDGSGLTGITGTLSGGQWPRVAYWTGANTLGNSSLSHDSASSLTLMNSSLTVQGSAFSVGGSTLVVTAGRVGLGGVPNLNANLDIYPFYGQTESMLYMRNSGGNYAQIRMRSDPALDILTETPNTPVKISPNAQNIAVFKYGLVGIGVNFNSPSSLLHVDGGSVTITGVPSTADYALKVGDNGLIISTGGAVQTTGLGHGSTAGSSRGLGAVDLQTSRSLAGQVASGDYSTIAGGANNTIISSYSVVAGGRSNQVSGYKSFIGGGENNNVNAEGGVIAGGASNTVNQWYGAIAGGLNNIAGEYGAVGGGASNSATGVHSAVAGGWNNQANGMDAFIGGGDGNQTFSAYSVVAGGKSNSMGGTNPRAFIGGGEANQIPSGGDFSVIVGGYGNILNKPYSAVLSGSTNTVSAPYSVVAGGLKNRIDADNGSVAGGAYNVISGSNSAVGGGAYNTVSGTSAVVAGGEQNDATHRYSAVTGGYGNLASGEYSVVGGGYNNRASQDKAVVSGGWGNTAGSLLSTVSGGFNNTAGSSYSTIGGGGSNKAGPNATVSGGNFNMATGQFSAVPGGYYNTANGPYSWAGGHYSSSTARGAFTWADSIGAEIRNNFPDRTLFKNEGGFMVAGSTVGGGADLPPNQAALDVISTATASNVYAQVWRNTSGQVVSSMTSQGKLYTANFGVCTTANVVISNSAMGQTCNGIPPAMNVAISCSGSSPFSSASTTALYCRPSGSSNQMICNTTQVNSTSMAYTCIWAIQ